MTTITDADELQEYECLRLEGYSETEARKLARAANDRINSKRLSGPLSASREGHGLRPLVSDYRYDLWLHDAKPLTLDTRSDDERLDDWNMCDRADSLMSVCTPLQKQALIVYYGLDTGERPSVAQAAARLGVTVAALESRRKKALARIRRFQGCMTEADKRAYIKMREAGRLDYQKKRGA